MEVPPVKHEEEEAQEADFLKNLEEASTPEEVAYFENKVLAQLQEESAPAVAYVRPAAFLVVRNMLPDYLKESELFNVDCAAYDDGGVRKIAIFVAFVQDYREVDEALEENILEALVTMVRLHHFEQVVNDVSVNSRQWRAGEDA